MSWGELIDTTLKFGVGITLMLAILFVGGFLLFWLVQLMCWIQNKVRDRIL